MQKIELEVLGVNVQRRNSDPPLHPSSDAGGVSQSKKKQSTTKLSSTSQSKSILESGLVSNLRQQIHCLEEQIKVLKERLDAKNPSLGMYQSKNDRQTSPPNGCTAKPMAPLDPLFHYTAIQKAVLNKNKSSYIELVPKDRTELTTDRYSQEIATLQHSLEALIIDVNEVQGMCLHLQREKEEMAREIADLHAAIREANDETSALRKEKMALTKEVKAKGTTSSMTSVPLGGNGSAALENVTQQRDFFKLQMDKAKMAQALAEARVEAFEVSLSQERNLSSQLEQQLCAALDRVSFLQKREETSADYYASLNNRFIALSAVLRRVTDPYDRTKVNEEVLSSPDVKAAIDELRTVQEKSMSRPRTGSLSASPPPKETPAEKNSATPPSQDTPAAKKKAPAVIEIAADDEPVKKRVSKPPGGGVRAPPEVKVPAPPTAAVPTPPVVSVPKKAPAIIEIDAAPVSVAVPRRPAPPTLQAQLDSLDAKIDKEMAKLSALVAKHSS